MPGGPHDPPSPAEMEAVQAAAKNAYGPFRPWMVVAALLLFLAPGFLNAPLWLTLPLGLVVVLGVIPL